MKRSNNKLRFLYLLVLTVILAIVVNLFLIIVGHKHIRSMTDLGPYIDSVSSVSEVIYANRGNIYDAHGEVVAQDIKTYDIICYLDKNRSSNKNNIAYVDDPLYTSQVLSMILDIDQEEIYEYLTPDHYLYQVELGPGGRNLTEDKVNEVLNYPNLHGIGFRTSYKRIYPKGDDFAPYIVGYARSDDTGKLVGEMGVEALYNEELSGIDGYHYFQRDKHGYVLPGMYEEITEAENGYDIYLTLDTSIQDALEISFDEITVQNNASQAWGAVVEIDTGKILAWGQTPSFNPNTLEVSEWNNYGSQVPYEPGSVFKSIIYSAAMDLGVYDGEAYFDSSPFCYLSNGSEPYRTYGGNNYGCIGNAGGKSWGSIPLDYGLIYSSNVATSTLLASYVGTANFLEYIERFGFFKNVETPGLNDINGVLNYTWPSEKLSLTYGQGSSVTTLQLLQAYTAIFGNGEMLKPYIIDKVVDVDNSEIIYEGERTVISRPIKESTAKSMQELLTRVVSDNGGTARVYGIDEVDIMAKTGTSEIASGFGYLSSDSISSVMLAFPADNPKYMIYYAYVSPYDYYNHLNSIVIQNFIKRVAILTNIGYNPNEYQIAQAIKKEEMPNLLNMTYEDAINELGENTHNIIKIGNGLNVIGQYPKAYTDYYTNEKVFILTDGENITLPDFKGWSRKELINYWNLSGIPITIDGYGVVYEQSIPSGSSISIYDEVIVKLDQISQNISNQEIEIIDEE